MNIVMERPHMFFESPLMLAGLYTLSMLVLALILKIAAVWQFMERFALLMITASVFCVGMSDLFWAGDLPKKFTYSLRILCIGVVIFLVVVHVRYWVRERSQSFRPLPNDVLDNSEFALSEGLRTHYEQGLERDAVQFDLRSSTNIECLIKQLVDPKPFRRRIHEKVRVEHRAILNAVTLHIPVANLNTSANGVTLISVARPLKQDAYRDTSVVDQAGNRVEALNYRQAQTALYALIQKQLQLHVTDNARLELFLVGVADVIASPRPEKDLALALYRDVTGETADPDMETDDHKKTLWGLLKVAALHRPIIVAYRGDTNTEVVLTVKTLNNLIPTPGVPDIREDWWHRFKRSTRELFGLSSTQIFVPVKRARSCLTYRMTFSAPKGTYIQETRAYSTDKKKWLPNNLDRHGLYRAFVGWSEPDGSNGCSFACRSLDATSITGVLFYVRVSERPPGTAGKAVLVSFATALVVWLCGALPLRSNSVSVDVVAMTLALPGVIAVWFGISDDIQPGSFRSIPALVSMAISGGISVLSIILYMGLASDKQQRIPNENWSDEDSFFMVDGQAWSFLLLFAALNLACIGASFLVSVHRYRQLVHGRGALLLH